MLCLGKGAGCCRWIQSVALAIESIVRGEMLWISATSRPLLWIRLLRLPRESNHSIFALLSCSTEPLTILPQQQSVYFATASTPTLPHAPRFGAHIYHGLWPPRANMIRIDGGVDIVFGTQPHWCAYNYDGLLRRKTHGSFMHHHFVHYILCNNVLCIQLS